jgi:hypothetical protein
MVKKSGPFAGGSEWPRGSADGNDEGMFGGGSSAKPLCREPGPERSGSGGRGLHQLLRTRLADGGIRPSRRGNGSVTTSSPGLCFHIIGQVVHTPSKQCANRSQPRREEMQFDLETGLAFRPLLRACASLVCTIVKTATIPVTTTCQQGQYRCLSKLPSSSGGRHGFCESRQCGRGSARKSEAGLCKRADRSPCSISQAPIMPSMILAPIAAAHFRKVPAKGLKVSWTSQRAHT